MKIEIRRIGLNGLEGKKNRTEPNIVDSNWFLVRFGSKT